MCQHILSGIVDNCGGAAEDKLVYQLCVGGRVTEAVKETIADVSSVSLSSERQNDSSLSRRPLPSSTHS